MEILSFEETKKLLVKYKLPLCQTEIFNSEEKAAAYAAKIGYPVVLKVHAQKIFHKSELGGVKVNIGSDGELYSAWEEIMKNVQGKNIEGILVQEMISGSEMALGMKRDAQFGPVIMFGLGGIFIEVIKDVSLRIAPVGKREAMEMIKEIKGRRILEGYRGKEPVDLNEVAGVICGISALSLAEERVSSIDFNPVIGNSKGVWIADLRIIV